MRWIAVIAFVLLLPAVHAFGISQDYHDNNTILVMQGTSALQKVVVQNDLDEPLDVHVVLSGEYVHVQGYPNSTKEANLTLPPRSYDSAFYINISVPPHAKAGEVVPVSFTVQPILENGGMVAMDVRLSDSFNVQVQKNPAYHSPLFIWVIAAAVLVLAAFAGLKAFRRRGNRKRLQPK